MRSKKSFLTMLTGIIPIFIIGVLGFVKIRYFIDLLGSEANGLIQIVYRILSYLSLAELGLGGALMYKLYKPLAENNHEEISKLIHTASYFFKKIGIGIVFFLLVFMFILPFVIKNNTFDNVYLYIIFLLAGIPYAVEYLWYKKYYILIAADQKQYINNIIFNGCTIIYDICIMIALNKGVNLIGYILVSYPFIIIKGIVLTKIFKKNYPYVSETKKIDKSSLSLSKDVFVHNIGSAINNGADQIVLSIFNGLTFVSIYSSYFYIVKYLKDITNSILKSTLYSFGNLFAKEDEINTKGYDVYKEYLSFSGMFSIVISSSFYFAIVPCINIWINKPEYILGFGAIIAFTLLVYSNIITIPLNIAAGAAGIFKQTKYYSFIATFVNVTLSILVIKKYQIAGIVFATIISTLGIWFPLTLRVVYKDVFNKHSRFDYYKEIIKSLIIISLTVLVINIFNLEKFYTGSIVNWIIVSFIFFIVISLITLVFYYITDNSYKRFLKRCINLIRKKGKNK